MVNFIKPLMNLKVMIPIVVLAFAGSNILAYNKGKNDAELSALSSALAEAERLRDLDIEFLMEGLASEVRVVEVIREVRYNVPTPDCTDLGNEWVFEANKVINALDP